MGQDRVMGGDRTKTGQGKDNDEHRQEWIVSDYAALMRQSRSPHAANARKYFTGLTSATSTGFIRFTRRASCCNPAGQMPMAESLLMWPRFLIRRKFAPHSSAQ